MFYLCYFTISQESRLTFFQLSLHSERLQAARTQKLLFIILFFTAQKNYCHGGVFYLFMLFISEALKPVLKRVSLKIISSYTMQQHNECEWDSMVKDKNSLLIFLRFFFSISIHSFETVNKKERVDSLAFTELMTHIVKILCWL